MSTTPVADQLAAFEDDLSEREIELIRSTYQVIARQGGHRMSVQDIADEAGVSKGLVLYHFGTKDDLLLSTMRWALLRTAMRIREGLEDATTPEETIDALLDAIFIGPQANRDFQLLYVDLVERAARDPSFDQLATMTFEIINGLYAELITDGVEQGVFDITHVDRAAAAMRALIDGTFLGWLQEPDWEARHEEAKLRCRAALMRLLGVAEG